MKSFLKASADVAVITTAIFLALCGFAIVFYIVSLIVIWLISLSAIPKILGILAFVWIVIFLFLGFLRLTGLK